MLRATRSESDPMMVDHFQDIHVITQHVQGRMSHYELVGKISLGVPTEIQHM